MWQFSAWVLELVAELVGVLQDILGNDRNASYFQVLLRRALRILPLWYTTDIAPFRSAED